MLDTVFFTINHDHFQTCSRWLSASEAAQGSQTAITDNQVLMLRPVMMDTNKTDLTHLF